MASITLEKLSKSFGKTHVLEELSLEIEDKEFVVLLGPSGCGKSTLLRMVAGLEEVSSGRILFGGEDVTHRNAGDRNVAMVFQSYALYPHMTVEENMSLALKLHGIDKAERTRRVTEAANMLGLSALLKRKPKELSGGQRQRVAMGRAIVREPRAFLFDEPLSNLDAELRLKMRTEIKRLHQRLKRTTLYVTHDQMEALTLADRVVLLRGGTVQQVGSPLDVFRSPANLFVAGFLGSPAMNFVPARVEEVGELRARIGITGFRAQVDLPTQAFSLATGRELILGLRPEEMRVSGGGFGDGNAHAAEAGVFPVRFPARVSLVEPLGTEMLVSLEPEGARGDADVLVHRCVMRDRVRVGDTVEVRMELSRLHIFDAESEQSLRL